jgi:hypothetical protein
MPDRFRSVDSALKYAFHCEAKRLYPKSCTDTLHIKGTSRSELTPLEKLVDGLPIKNAALGILGLRGRRVICAEFREPVGATLEVEKEWDINWLGAAVRNDLKSNVDRWFFADVVREWCGEIMHKSYIQWSDHLKKPVSTLHGLAKRKDRPSVVNLLSKWRMMAMAEIEVEFVKRGLL